MNGLEGLLLAVHMSLSAILDQPALQLSQGEAQAIAASASNVARHYDLRTSQKVLDWGALGVTLAGIYGPRFAFMYNEARKATSAARPGAGLPPAGESGSSPAGDLSTANMPWPGALAAGSA